MEKDSRIEVLGLDMIGIIKLKIGRGWEGFLSKAQLVLKWPNWITPDFVSNLKTINLLNGINPLDSFFETWSQHDSFTISNLITILQILGFEVLIKEIKNAQLEQFSQTSKELMGHQAAKPFAASALKVVTRLQITSRMTEPLSIPITQSKPYLLAIPILARCSLLVMGNYVPVTLTLVEKSSQQKLGAFSSCMGIWYDLNPGEYVLHLSSNTVPEAKIQYFTIVETNQPVNPKLLMETKSVHCIAPSHHYQQQTLSQSPGGGAQHAAVVIDYKWKPGQEITVKFLTTPEFDDQDLIRECAKEWEKYANIRFKFVTQPDANIRIAFDKLDGFWSVLGTSCLSNKNQTKPTMNLGLDASIANVKGNILHEFGHALGLIHAHQNPEARIAWDPEAVVKYYNNHGWDLVTIMENVLQPDDEDKLQNLDDRFDKDSIMAYPIEKSLLKPEQHHFATGFHSVLSAHDIESIKTIYPK